MATFDPGDWLTSPFWPDSAQVISNEQRSGYDLLALRLDDRAATYVLTSDDWAAVRPVSGADQPHITFTGDPALFRLGVLAHRLRLAHSIDPFAALNSSRIDPLPHQYEAAYEHLLTRPVVRALVAHDAGAGKTIIAGIVIKELKRRYGAKRILIVAPAGLTGQWRRELLTKFGENFAVVSREYMAETGLDSYDVWRQTDLAITSVTFARQKSMRNVLEGVEWDAVIVDEAHNMAAYRAPNGRIDERLAYKLGKTLSRRSKHFLLMTATPHKGDSDNYRLLVSLLDPNWGDAAAYATGANPMVLRRTKEEMLTETGAPLYPRRNVDTQPYRLSRQEGALLEQVLKFVNRHYAEAKKANRQSAAFALILLSRRLASSPYALRESLLRLARGIEARLRSDQPLPVTAGDEDTAEWEDLDEHERWQREQAAENDLVALAKRSQLEAERRELANLLRLTDAVIARGDTDKLKTLYAACDLWVRERGEQMIIFTEFKDTLDFLVAQLEQRGHRTTQIHGGMNVHERRAAEKRFWNNEAQILLATEAAGEGVNLQCCHVMINFDIPWNPCRLEQRMGRIHRYGQKAPEVFIFNLLAANSAEDEVKAAIIQKQQEMRKDLGDKVFDVIGATLWNADLRAALERIALGDDSAVERARRLIDEAGSAAAAALEAERRASITSQPLDVAKFRRQQARFRAHRLSPEAAEAFFREAVVFAGGAVAEEQITDAAGVVYTALRVRLPADVARTKGEQRFSFWAPICSDDDTDADAVLFIAPGHWLFELLLTRVLDACTPALRHGAIFQEATPASESPYLLWLVQAQVRDGLDRRVTDFFAAVQHHADAEDVQQAPSEFVDGLIDEPADKAAASVQRIQPMLAGQQAVLDQCVTQVFLPRLAEQRGEHTAIIERDRMCFSDGLRAIADLLSDQLIDAYARDDAALGEELQERLDHAQARLKRLNEELTRAQHLILLGPKVLGVALVLPSMQPDAPAAPSGRTMRQNKEAEIAAMQIVMHYEQMHGRRPKDVHGHESWDIESYAADGVLERFIEVKARGPESAAEVELTDPEWQAARRHGAQHWLYVVRLEDGQLWKTQDPYTSLQPQEKKRWIVKLSDVAHQTSAESVAAIMKASVA